MPSSYKYSLALVPGQTDSVEKVLKNWIASKKVMLGANSSNTEEFKRHKILMHCIVASNAKFQDKIS